VADAGTEERSAEPAFGFSTGDSGEQDTPELPARSEKVTWKFGDENDAPVNLAPANADVLPPDSDKPSRTEWLNSNRPAALVVALIVLAAALFAGFTFMGGDDGSTGTGPNGAAIGDTPSKVVVRKLNALCKSAKREIKGLGTPTTPDELVTYMTGVQRTYSGFLKDLKHIKAGPEVGADFARLVKDFKQAARYADETLAAARAGDLATAQEMMQRIDAESTKMNARARAFGAHACASA
jgi:hypothetical protein